MTCDNVAAVRVCCCYWGTAAFITNAIPLSVLPWVRFFACVFVQDSYGANLKDTQARGRDDSMLMLYLYRVLSC